MISAFIGEDSFAVSEKLAELAHEFDGAVERIDGASLQVNNLPDLLMGGTLFSQKRLVVIRDVASNSVVAEKLAEWLEKTSDDIHLVIVESKLDKRSKLYKALKKEALVQEFVGWTEKNSRDAERWVSERSKLLKINIKPAAVGHLVRRVGTDKWALSKSLEKLQLAGSDIDANIIDDIIVPSVSENVFTLFELSLQGQASRLLDMLRSLELQEDAHAIFGLISSQSMQLLAVARSEPSDSPEKDLGIHPYVASKFQQQAKRYGLRKIEDIAEKVAQTDRDLKTTSVEPWLLVERLLLSIAI